MHDCKVSRKPLGPWADYSRREFAHPTTEGRWMDAPVWLGRPLFSPKHERSARHCLEVCTTPESCPQSTTIVMPVG
jgi:hypothetical protein